MELIDIKIEKLRQILSKKYPNSQINLLKTNNLLRFVLAIEIIAEFGEAWFENITEEGLNNYLKDPELTANFLSFSQKRTKK